jgi:cytochrome c553
MPKHVVRLLGLMAVGLVVALVATWFLTPDSFYRFGHYRANAVTEVASLQPVYMTSASCENCHDDRHPEWASSSHKSVACETCHGPGAGHPKGGKKKLPIPQDTTHLCTLCHEATAGRPTTQPQIVVAEHKNGEKCVPCHDPHMPKNAAKVALTGKVEQGKVLAARACAECHGNDGISPNETWPNLAGLSAAYLVKITTAYKTGDQKDVAMTPLAKKLSDADIQDLSAYYASLSCGVAKPGSFRGDAESGKSLARHCARCHGETGVSPIGSWPLLAGQAPGYLVNVLKAYRAGLRKDAVMVSAAGSLSDTDIADLAAFYSVQKCTVDK